MILTTILLVAIKKAFYLLTWYTKVDLKSRNEREQKSQLHSTLKSNVRFRLPPSNIKGNEITSQTKHIQSHVSKIFLR